MVLGIIRDVLAAIPAYTGLSPVAFFTIAALLITLFYVVAGFFAPPPTPAPVARYEPPPPPVQLGDVSEAELLAYDGSDPSKPLLMAIKGQIYDVSQSRAFYGPGGPYALFAGRDASKALAKMSFEEADLTGNIEGLNAMELDTLQDWEWKFMTKYVKVGQIPSDKNNKSSEAVSTQEDGNTKDEECVESKSREVQSVQEGENDQDDGQVESVKAEQTECSPDIKSQEGVPAVDVSASSNGDVKVKEEEG